MPSSRTNFIPINNGYIHQSFSSHAILSSTLYQNIGGLATGLSVASLPAGVNAGQKGMKPSSSGNSLSSLLPAGGKTGGKAGGKAPSAKMKLSWKAYDLALKHTFTISGFSRKSTPVVLTKIECDGVTGYGEASLPPTWVRHKPP